MLKKKNNSWTIDYLETFPIKAISEEVRKYESEWLIDTTRQDNSVTHKHTNMFQLIYSDYLWDGKQPLKIIKINELLEQEAKKELQNIFMFLENHFSGIICRAEIVKMLPNSHIRTHVDAGYWLQHARRCHLPLITDPGVTMTVENNTMHLEKGKLYEINNGMRHSVDNPTNIERIHAIIDVMPLEIMDKHNESNS